MSAAGSRHLNRRQLLSLAGSGGLILALPAPARAWARAISKGASSTATSIFRCPASPASIRSIVSRKRRKGLMSQRVLRSGPQLTVIEEWSHLPETADNRYQRLDL